MKPGIITYLFKNIYKKLTLILLEVIPLCHVPACGEVVFRLLTVNHHYQRVGWNTWDKMVNITDIKFIHAPSKSNSGGKILIKMHKIALNFPL